MNSKQNPTLYAVRHPGIGLYLISSRLHWPQRERVIAEVLKTILSHTEGSHRFRVVDVGCGPALLSETVIRSGLEYLGLDKDPRWIEYCRRQRPRPRVSFVCCDVSINSVNVGPDDIVIMNGLVHHLNDEQLERTLNAITGAHTLIVEDHRRDDQWSIWKLPRLMQALDRGRHVRPSDFFASLPGFVLTGSTHFPIRQAGITLWEFFAYVYRPCAATQAS